MQLIDGKGTAAEIKAEIAAEVKHIISGGGNNPILLLYLLDMMVDLKLMSEIRLLHANNVGLSQH